MVRPNSLISNEGKDFLTGNPNHLQSHQEPVVKGEELSLMGLDRPAYSPRD